MTPAKGLEYLNTATSKMRAEANGSPFRFPVYIIFTSLHPTLGALKKTGQLAALLKSGIKILVAQAVPYLLPLDEFVVRQDFVGKLLEKMAANVPEKTSISAYFCRDRLQALQRVLGRGNPVVMVIKKRGWPTRDERLARRLRHAGYDVILVETE
jgi:hypothetical protein